MITNWLTPASATQRLDNWYLDRFHRDIVRVLEQHAGMTSASRVAEFGCNRGILAHFLMPRCRRLILCDLSDRRETSAARACEFRQNRAEMSGLETASLDVLVLLSVYHHLADFDQFTKEAARILRPNGTLVLIEPIKHHPIIMVLNGLAPWLHPGDRNLSEPYGLALWINRAFMTKKLSTGFRMVHCERLDWFLYGINCFVPRALLKAYFTIQKLTRFGNVEAYIFQNIAPMRFA